MSALKVFSGTTHKKLAEDICKNLKIPLSSVIVKKFPDSEVYVKFTEKVRGENVFIIQPTSRPVNESIMELLVMMDALKRSSVGQINVVIPYYGYGRQDRRTSAREPITSKLVANLLTSAGATRLITVDLHTEQQVGFFDIPVDHFEGHPIFAEHLKKLNLKDIVAVAPDAGFAKKARRFAALMDCPLVIVDKRRTAHNKSEVVNLIGNVEGKTCILLDDIIDTAGTISSAADTLDKNGAKEVYICATHPVLSNNAADKLQNCKAKKIFFTDTIPIPTENMRNKFEIISISELMAQVIKRIHENKSLGELFYWEELDG